MSRWSLVCLPGLVVIIGDFDPTNFSIALVTL